MKNISIEAKTVERALLDTLILTPSDELLAREVHSRFSKLEGSQHIASRGSLQWLVTVLRTMRPTRVLELGAGIGTMTELLLDPRFGVEEVYTTETDSFCLNALNENLT